MYGVHLVLLLVLYVSWSGPCSAHKVLVLYRSTEANTKMSSLAAILTCRILDTLLSYLHLRKQGDDHHEEQPNTNPALRC